MLNHRSTLRLAGLLALIAWPAVVQAGILTFAFEGHITSKTDPLGKLTFADINDSILYLFSFDTTTPDTSPPPLTALYSGTSSHVTINQTDFQANAPTIIIQHPGDLFDVSSTMSIGLTGFTASGSTSFVLSDQVESDALNSVALPLVPYDLTRFIDRSITLSFPVLPASSDVVLFVDGYIDTMYLVPEPATLFGLLAFTALLSHRIRHRFSATEIQPC